ncbi:hypothetical protein [Amycolatopsis plumensis]|uniref:Uncharacterized protein n=1 Tax=Amycolatopsis plumensis TaxID=236508 RepID=A0ABV5TXL0_9PSEU
MTTVAAVSASSCCSPSPAAGPGSATACRRLNFRGGADVDVTLTGPDGGSTSVSSG